MVDLNKEISNPFAKKEPVAAVDGAAEGAKAANPKSAAKAGRGSEYPTKRYMNLAQQQSTQFNARKMLPALIIAVLAVALFAYFGVFSFLGQLSAKQGELSQVQGQISQLQAQLKDYDKVESEYSQYSGLAIGGNATSPSITEVLTMVEGTVSTQATVSKVNLEGSTLTLTITDSNLDQVASVTTALQEQPMVQSVRVSTAATTKNDNGAVTTDLEVQLQDPKAAEATGQASQSGKGA